MLLILAKILYVAFISLANLFTAWEREVIATVPKDRLLKFHVKDGWGPLAQFVGAQTPPESEPFPRVNDKAQFQWAMNLLCFSVYFTFLVVIVGFVFLLRCIKRGASFNDKKRR